LSAALAGTHTNAECCQTQVDGYKSILREKAFTHAINHPNVAKLRYQCVSPNYPSGEDDDATVFFIMEDGTRCENPDGTWQAGGNTVRE
jgi:hypothetical protein